jgi:hypothetical protein
MMHMAQHPRIYTTICLLILALPFSLIAQEISEDPAAQSHHFSHSFVHGMTLAPFIQIPWILGWGIGQAETKPASHTMRTIFLEFVDGTAQEDVMMGISGLVVQQVILTELVRIIGSHHHNNFLRHPFCAWLASNVLLTIFKLFRVKNNLIRLNHMIAGMKKLNLTSLIAFQRAKAKGLHGFIFN